MLTPKNIKAKTAIEYFKQGYYQKGKWLGKGAASLGLKGEIKNDRVYENIVKGLSPDGTKRLNKREVHTDKRKAAVDCTFAAPKSVSLCALVGNDERLILAHKRAVEKVLELMEAKYAQSRVMLDGTQEVVKTGNLVIARYDHIESRDLDPHLHSHCLVMNMTQLPNGEWYSHLNDEIFRNQKLLGMAYQHYLALEVQKLGYEIELKEHGQFDIKGYSESDLNDFSKRRMQILALAGADASSVERELAWSKTRRNKENVTNEELKARWQQEAAVLGIKIVSPGAPSPEAVSNQVEPKIFADAIRYCSERQVAFRAEDIQAFILAESKPLDIATVEPSINSSDQLIRLQEQNGLRYTTVAAVERELATINLMKAGQGKFSAIAHPEIVEEFLKQTSLNEGQRQAVMMTLATSDQFIAWQGVAGAGKTFALKLVLSLAQKQGYSVKGFAPSAKASTILGQELAAQTQTVARLLASKSPDQIETKQIWIVDETGLLSAKDAQSLFQRATRELARVILVGDTRQLSAVEAGNPFKSLQQAGIETAYLNESQRQKDSPQLKVAIDLLAEGRVEAGFARLKEIECIQKVTRETKLDEIIRAYLKATPEQRAKTLVLAGTNVERLELTGALRKALQAEGSLGSDVTLTQLKSKDLREVQLGYTSHFALGDLVMPLRDYKRKGLEKGELYEVIGTATDTIKLIAPDGRELHVSLNFKKAVYQREQIEIAVGDRLVWKKNDRQKGQVNGFEVTVVGINGNAVEVVDAQGKTQTLDLKSPHHLDHGIVRTTFSAQGETADCVFVAADSTIGKESFYVAASRARSKLRFFTTNENELLQWAIRSRAQENPLELIRNQVQQQHLEQLVVVGQPSTTSNISVASPPPVTRTAKLESSHPQRLTPKPARRTEPSEKPQPSSSITPALTPQGIPKPKIPTTPFWTPTGAGVPPRQIEEKHWRELVEGSAINPALVEANVYSVSGRGVYERLLSTKLEKIGTGQYVTQPAAKLMKAYEQVALGGWWAESGIDALSLPDLKPGEKPSNKLWGCFKADNPRVDADKSQRKGETAYIKYEHPLVEERQLFLFDVPDALAQRIYDKYAIQPTDAEKQSGFWYIVHKYNLPITLAEGAKKTLSSLSQGEITIGLSGVNGGYFAKDNQKNKLRDRILHPELKIFATPAREFKFAFDQDSKESTIWNVRRDMVRTGELLELEGSNVHVAQWQGDKGLDDLIVNQGALAYAHALSNSIPLDPEAQKHYRGEYNRLARKVRDSQPTLSDEAIDVEIYQLAQLKGDIRDGARTIAQSNMARLFRATLPQDEGKEKTLSYIQQIEKSISHSAGQIQPEQQQQLPIIPQIPLHYRANPIPLGVKITSSNLFVPGQESDRTQKQQLARIEQNQHQAEQNTNAMITRVEQLRLKPLDNLVDPVEQESQTKQQQSDQSNTTHEIIDAQTLTGIDSTSFGKSIAQQLSTGTVEVQPKNTELLHKASKTRQQLKFPIPQLQLKQNPSIPISPLQGKTNQLLNTAQDGDRINSLQLDRIEQLQHRADRATDLACSRLEEISRHQPLTPLELTTEQLSTKPEHQEITNDFTTTRNTQQPRTIDGEDLGRSIAANLEASDDRTEGNQNRAEQLLLRARSSGRARRSLGAIQPVSHSLVQPGINQNQQRPFLPVPTGERTKGNSLSLLENQQDRSLTRQLEQINRHQFSANTQTDRTLSRLGNFHANLSLTDEAGEGVVAENRGLDQSNPKLPAQQQQPILTNPIAPQEAQTKSRLENDEVMSPNPIDEQEWVKIKTKRPQLSQWNERIGIVVARPLGNVYVSIDGYTPSFFETEVEPIKPVQGEALSNQRKEQQVQSTAQTTPNPFPNQQSTPLSPQATTNKQAIINPNSSSTNESHDTQHSRTVDGTSIGRSISSRLEADCLAARHNGESARAARRLDSNFTTSDNRRHQTISGQIETSRAETHPGIRPNSQRLRELGIQLRSTANRVVERGGQSNYQAERANQDTAAVEQNNISADATAAGIEQNHQRITTNYRTTNEATTANQRAASESYRVFEQRRESLKALADQMRSLPLEDVVTRLGLELDRYDKHKWRGEGIISINNQKFYDHTCQKGGYGAIDLVMHVQQQNFKQAVDWLSNSASSLPSRTARSQQSKALPEERKPFTQPIADESKWLAVRQYLTEKRHLPPALVDELHYQGRVYADIKQNAVFIRKSIEGDITGASLRGTYNDSQFKGLATGSRRDRGWFAFSSGSGKLERIVLTESPIDAMSAAALSKQKTGITLFISNDGAGSIPTDFLQQQLTKGKQVLVAYDADIAGEEMARQVIAALPGATRVKPSFGKDWNERLVMHQEALETAQALRQLFERLPSDVRISHPNGCLTLDTPSWQLAQQGNAVSITNKQDNREILRVEGERPVVLDPTPTQRQKIKKFCQDIARNLVDNPLNQHNLQVQQQEGQEQRRGQKR